MGFGAVLGSLYFQFPRLPSENVFLEVSHSNFSLTCPQDSHVFSDNRSAACAKQNPGLYFPSFSPPGSAPSLVSAFALSPLLP